MQVDESLSHKDLQILFYLMSGSSKNTCRPPGKCLAEHLECLTEKTTFWTGIKILPICVSLNVLYGVCPSVSIFLLSEKKNAPIAHRHTEQGSKTSNRLFQLLARKWCFQWHWQIAYLPEMRFINAFHTYG